MSKRLAAVFTIAQDEPVFLPIWSSYYRKQFPAQDVYVLDHDSQDLNTVAAANTCNRVPVHHSESFDHRCLRDTVQDFQRFLLKSYEYVLFAEADEIVIADPEYYPDLTRYVEHLVDTRAPSVKCRGFELVEVPGEDPLVMGQGRTILSQRKWMQPSITYSKVLLSSLPCQWELGFHRLRCGSEPRLTVPPLNLVHLHRMDYALAWKRCQDTAAKPWSSFDRSEGFGHQNRITDEGEFRKWYFNSFSDGRPFNPCVVPELWRGLV